MPVERGVAHCVGDDEGGTTGGFKLSTNTRVCMPDVELELPDRITSEIDRLVQQGEFLNRDQAVEELLQMGVSAYQTTEDTGREEESLFTEAVDDQQDPAMRDEGGGDDYTF